MNSAVVEHKQGESVAEELRQQIAQLYQIVQQQQAVLAQAQRGGAQAVPNAVESVSVGNVGRVTKLSTFDGSQSHNAHAWIIEVENYFSACSVIEDRKVPTAVQLLREDAAIWWASLHTTPQNMTWQQFKQQFTDNYQPVATKETARVALHSLTQRKGMTVAEYCRQFRYYLSLLSGDGMSEDYKVFMFQRGLQFHIQNEVRIRNPTTLIQAMSYAQSAEINRNMMSNNNRPSTQSYRNNSVFRSFGNSYGNPSVQSSSLQSVPSPTAYRTTESTPMELGQMSGGMHDGSVNGVLPEIAAETEQLNAVQSRSRVSGLTRQMYEECRQRGVCFVCKRPGHIARFCKNGNNNNSNSQSKNTQGQQPRQL